MLTLCGSFLFQNSGNDTEGTACDISTDLLMVKLLGLHSKEDRSPEMKEQDEKKLSPEVRINKKYQEQYTGFPEEGGNILLGNEIVQVYVLGNAKSTRIYIR